MENRYKINYDMKTRLISNIKFKQGDSDGSVIEVSLFDNSLPINITSEVIEFRFLKIDGTVVYQDISTSVTVLDPINGKLECILMGNTLASAGMVKVEIHRTLGDKQLTTPSFTFTVETSIGESGALSTNYIGKIESKINEWQIEFDASELIRATGEANRVTAENSRAIAFTNMAHIDANLEISTARGGEVDLDTRLDKSDTQLASIPQQLRTLQNNTINATGAVLTFIDDDCRSEWKTWWPSIIASKGIKISLAAIGNCIGTADYMTQQELLDLQTAGHDILSHGLDGIDVPNSTVTVVDSDCKDGQTKLKSMGFINGTDYLVYSGGLSNVNVTMKNIARKYYKYGIGTSQVSGLQYNSMPVDNWGLTRDTEKGKTIATLKADLDSAIANNGWIIVLSHSHLIDAPEQQNLSDLIDYAKSLNIPILPFTEAVKYKGNAIAVGEATNENSSFVGVDGVAKISLNKGLFVTNPAKFTMSSLITDYKQDSVTFASLDTVGDTLLSKGGTMEIFRNSNSDVYSYAIFKPIGVNMLYSRHWSGGIWQPWVAIGDGNGTIFNLANDGSILTQPISYFPQDKVSIYPSSNTSTSPELGAGLYKVYRPFQASDFYSYSTYKMQSTNTEYTRRWSGGIWQPWVKLGQGVGTTVQRQAIPSMCLNVADQWYDTNLTKPLWLKNLGIQEKDTLTVTTGATTSGNITITLNGIAFTVAVLAGDTAISIATKIRAAAFTGWLTSGTTGTTIVVFTKNSTGTVTTSTFTDTGATSAVSTFTITTAGVANVWADATGTTV